MKLGIEWNQGLRIFLSEIDLASFEHIVGDAIGAAVFFRFKATEYRIRPQHSATTMVNMHLEEEKNQYLISALYERRDTW